MLRFDRLPVAGALAAHVESCWFMRGASAAALPEGHRILPDGCMEFVFQLGAPFLELGVEERWHEQPARLLVGQMTRRVEVRPGGEIDTVGLHFHPAGAAAFVAGSMKRFRDRITDLDTALGEDLAPLAGRLRRARSSGSRMALLMDWLQGRIGSADALVAQASRRLLDSAGQLDIPSLGPALGLGERQLRRRFEAAVGLAPKRFARLLRFQRVFEQQRESDAMAWAQVALECGYCDQAHFNRDFRAFSGLAPRQLLADADPLTAFFLSVSSKTARAT
ncbi:MAG: AraC family transcriptional regulator [Rubrivivax sp.]|nr:MAG: AraC family transcriptional regulator [Rubrivivax sp.]